ncbi:hypothetical protein VNO77_04143 [Canavalia gladiata]|uniref:Uncharacterized protein n=1 Tax=Canavalia gladiata TaxID=3824 RepID=A0AAN9R8S7_CANGL
MAHGLFKVSRLGGVFLVARGSSTTGRLTWWLWLVRSLAARLTAHGLLWVMALGIKLKASLRDLHGVAWGLLKYYGTEELPLSPSLIPNICDIESGEKSY